MKLLPQTCYAAPLIDPRSGYRASDQPTRTACMGTKADMYPSPSYDCELVQDRLTGTAPVSYTLLRHPPPLITVIE